MPCGKSQIDSNKSVVRSLLPTQKRFSLMGIMESNFLSNSFLLISFAQKEGIYVFLNILFLAESLTINVSLNL